MLDTYAFSSPRRFALRVLLPVAITMLTIASAAHAQIWNEVGDAGDLPVTAQSTVGTGLLASIKGALGSPTDVDMYCIQVPDPTGFIAALQCVVIQGPNLWIFDATGKGVGASTTCQGGDKRVTSVLVNLPGTYYVAVAYDAVYPYSGANAMWTLAYMTQRAPDGPGAAGIVTSWSGTPNVQPLNPYQIRFFGGGTYYCTTPATSARAGTWGSLKLLYR